MKPKRLTNTQFIKRLMEYSPYGALAQLFIIDAITKHAEYISRQTDANMKKACDGDIINPKAWKGVATDIHKQLEAFYKPFKQDDKP